MPFRLILVLVLVCSTLSLVAQESDSLFNRLQAITSGNGYDYFHVDGIEITLGTTQGEFSPKSLAKKFKPFKVKASELTASDSLLGRTNYYLHKTYERAPGLTGYIDYYFVGDKDRLVVVSFLSPYVADRELERKIVLLCADRKMPVSIYQPADRSLANFAGRELKLGGYCQWMGPNNLQCPGNGQMNWSSHRTMESARLSIDDHYKFLNAGQKGKIISDSQVDVVFEEQEVKARKLVYDFTGVTSALVGMTGGKTLTIYMVAAPVRGKFVSCVMSHWNNDGVNEQGLPALTALVMRVK